jgi:hypothetical protein
MSMKRKILTIAVCLLLIGAIAYGLKYNANEQDTSTWFVENNGEKSVPSKDYLKMKSKLEKENRNELICVGTVMCHKCNKIKHICDIDKNKKSKLQDKCLDWYCGELIWYCEDCICDATN